MKRLSESRPLEDPISREKDQIYPPLIDDINQWPINKLTENRSAFVKKLEAYSFNTISRKSTDFIKDLIQKQFSRRKPESRKNPGELILPMTGYSGIESAKKWPIRISIPVIRKKKMSMRA
ncbi:MAG: hypothetical protein IPI42_02010 [Saprospiraceae bacterium]|nr:hypothetical protein [Candidatus Parvibacillus calidus]